MYKRNAKNARPARACIIAEAGVPKPPVGLNPDPGPVKDSSQTRPRPRS